MIDTHQLCNLFEQARFQTRALCQELYRMFPQQSITIGIRHGTVNAREFDNRVAQWDAPSFDKAAIPFVTIEGPALSAHQHCHAAAHMPAWMESSTAASGPFVGHLLANLPFVQGPLGHIALHHRLSPQGALRTSLFINGLQMVDGNGGRTLGNDTAAHIAAILRARQNLSQPRYQFLTRGTARVTAASRQQALDFYEHSQGRTLGFLPSILWKPASSTGGLA